MFNTAELLSDLEKCRFYGSVELKFEAGKLVLVRKSETLKTFNDYRDNRGSGNERT
jgi:hypothetical protein